MTEGSKTDWSGLNGKFIDLRERCLSQPTRIDCAILEAVMLSPRDPEKRQSFLITSFAEHFKSRPDEIQEILGASALDFFYRARHLSDQLESSHSAVHQGVAVGSVCGDVIARTLAGDGKVTMKSAFEHYSSAGALRRQIQDRHGVGNIGYSHFNNEVLPSMRPVAHFWTAFVWHTQKSGDAIFPCRASRIAEFLGEAKAFLDIGARTRMYKSAFTLFDETNAVRPPFDVPRVELQVGSPQN